MSEKHRQLLQFNREHVEQCYVTATEDDPIILLCDVSDTNGKQALITFAGEAETERRIAEYGKSDPALTVSFSVSRKDASWAFEGMGEIIKQRIVAAVDPGQFRVMVFGGGSISFVHLPVPD